MQNSVAQMPNSAPQMSNFESIQVDSSTLVTTIRSAVNFYTRNVDKINFLLFDFQLARMLVLDLTSLFKKFFMHGKLMHKFWPKSDANLRFFFMHGISMRKKFFMHEKSPNKFW